MPNDHFEQLIEQLKPVVNEPDFDSIFRNLTEGEDGPTRFQLKMELRRLASPCIQTVDLRHRVAGDCQPYEFLGRKHYLDDVAKDIFERGLTIYQGVFTQDTYEHIMAAENNHRVMQEKDRERARMRESQHAERVATRADLAKNDQVRPPYLVDTFHFGQYPYRAEERMNFTVEVLLSDAQDRQVKALTSDISITGLRVRIDKAQLGEVGESIAVYFTGLAKEFTLDAELAVPYHVIAVEQHGDRRYLSLNRDANFSSKQFDQFLAQFINGYKKRYRINIDNTYQALMNKGHEQFLMPRLSSLPMFFSVQNKQLHADYILSTDNNRHIVEDWISEQNSIVIGSMFNPRRSQYLIKQLANNSSATVTLLSFNITARGKIHYYSAIAEELKKTGYWQTFINFAARKASFRVYQFRFKAIQTDQAWQPQSVPLDVQIPFRQQPPSPKVKDALQPIQYLGVMTDLTDSMRDFAGEHYDKEKVRALKTFLHPPAVPIRTKEVRLEFTDLRQEQRFSYRSRCRVRLGKKLREGIIMDLSVHGLKIQLDDPLAATVNDTLLISLTGFEKQHKKFKLHELPYQVVNIDMSGSTLSLKVADKKKPHEGRTFFQYLIDQHRQQLQLVHENSSLHGLELCLRNLYCQAPPTVPLFFYQNKKRHITLRRAGLSRWLTVWHQLLNSLPGSSAQSLNIQPILRGDNLRSQLIPALQDLSRANTPTRKLLLLKLYHERGEAVLQTEWQSVNSLDTESVNAFIDQCLPDAVFIAIQIELSRTGRPDTQFVQAEMSYLSLYAAHRANDLEEELWQVYGIADTLDVTADLLKFADLDDEQIQRQHQRIEQWLQY